MSVVCAYYKGRHGRAPEKGVDADFESYVKEAFRGLAKIYPSQVMKRAPILPKQMRALRKTMDLQEPKEATLWALHCGRSGYRSGRGSGGAEKSSEARKTDARPGKRIKGPMLAG